MYLKNYVLTGLKMRIAECKQLCKVKIKDFRENNCILLKKNVKNTRIRLLRNETVDYISIAIKKKITFTIFLGKIC